MLKLLPVALLTVLACCGDREFPTFTTTRATTADGVAVTFVPIFPEPFDRLTWDFGDGTSSTERAPTHVYNRNAHYSVMLTVETANEFAMVPGTVLVAELPLPPPAVVHGFLDVPGYQLHGVNLLRDGQPAPSGPRAVAYAFRRDEDGVTTVPFGAAPSVVFRPADGDQPPVALVLADGLHTATLDRLQAYSPSWLRDGEPFSPSSEQMPLMRGVVPIALKLSPFTANAHHVLSEDFTVTLAGEVDISTIDEVVYVLRGQQGLLSFRVEGASGHAPQLITAAQLATLGTGVAEVYATVRNVTTSVVDGVSLTVVNAATTAGAVVFTP